MLGTPAVIQIVKPLRVCFQGVEAERKNIAARGQRIGLAEDRTSVGLLRGGIVKAAHARQRAEIMIEGAVLLHHDDEMIDVAELAFRLRRGIRRGRNRGQRGCGRARLDEMPAVNVGHGLLPNAQDPYGRI